jgi:CyaY protein
LAAACNAEEARKPGQQQRAYSRRRHRLDRYTCLAPQHATILPTMTSPMAPDAMTDSEYHARTAAILAHIEASIDTWLQEGVIDIDTQRSGGLLELSFPNDSKIVINVQPPLQELWLAARAGGFHYRHVQGRWIDTRDGSEFFDALSACASAQAGKELRFAPPT